MIDYYNIQDFTEITTDQLISDFENKSTIQMGSLSIYNGSLGKPGDRIFKLKNITTFSGGIDFHFDTNKIRIFEPSKIVVNAKIIGIGKCSHIIWYGQNKIFGETTPATQPDSKKLSDLLYGYKNDTDAFLFYSW